MNFSQDTSEEPTYIYSYHEDYLVVNKAKYEYHCLIHRDGMIKAWQPANPGDLTHHEFDDLLVFQPEVVLLGTGKRLLFPSNALRKYFQQLNIGLEIMDTGAACRTYNILLTEGRNVAAAILLDQEFSKPK